MGLEDNVYFNCSIIKLIWRVL